MSNPDLTAYLAETQNLECDYIAELISSRHKAWCIALAAGLITLLALLAVVGLIPLKEVTPLVLRVDNATGQVELVTTLRAVEHTYGEVVDTYFLNQYVINRETYDYQTLQNLYDLTGLLSHPDVQQGYQALYSGPQARDKVLGMNAKITVQVRSITPDTQTGVATVRFSTQQRQSNGVIQPVQNWLATISYHYVDAAMSVADRRLNPLGFQVTSYRLDPETLAVGDQL